jgi:hypothetical protein
MCKGLTATVTLDFITCKTLSGPRMTSKNLRATASNAPLFRWPSQPGSQPGNPNTSEEQRLILGMNNLNGVDACNARQFDEDEIKAFRIS